MRATIKNLVFILIMFQVASCASLSRHYSVVERDNFLSKFPIMNNEILGELKYNDSTLDLRTLGIKDYSELYKKIDLTNDDKEVIEFIQNNAPEKIFIMFHDTFVICLKAENYSCIVCDDAETPGLDKIYTKEPLPSIKDFSTEFLKGRALSTGN